MRRRTRVRGTGNFARWLTFPIPLYFLGTTSYRLAYGSADFPSADPLTWENSPIYFAWLLGSLAVFSRGAMLGVWIGERDVVIRGWLSSVSLEREDIVNCRSLPYVGFLTRWSDSTVIRMLGFRMAEEAVLNRRGQLTRWMSDYGTFDARGTAALAPFSSKQAERVSVMLGLRDQQSDNAPRHRSNRNPGDRSRGIPASAASDGGIAGGGVSLSLSGDSVATVWQRPDCAPMTARECPG